ncbi:MAG: hypothetical protein IPL03_04660 [Sterolibacteriaceae bacterium]|nr:hypothetical protein [Candidatus Methylophosphatis haderslevensis]
MRNDFMQSLQMKELVVARILRIAGQVRHRPGSAAWAARTRRCRNIAAARAKVTIVHSARIIAAVKYGSNAGISRHAGRRRRAPQRA